MASRMFATLVSKAGDGPISPGDLVCVKVPANCTIQSPDAARLTRLRVLAAEFKAQWESGISPDRQHPLLCALSEVADDLDNIHIGPNGPESEFWQLSATGGTGGAGPAGTGAAGGGSGGGGVRP